MNKAIVLLTLVIYLAACTAAPPEAPLSPATQPSLISTSLPPMPTHWPRKTISDQKRYIHN